MHSKKSQSAAFWAATGRIRLSVAKTERTLSRDNLLSLNVALDGQTRMYPDRSV